MSVWGAKARVWVLAFFGGLLVAVMVLSLVRTPRSPAHRAASKSISPTQVELALKGDTLLKEEAGLRDPTPLFLPTRWNASEDALALNAPREPGGFFQEYPPSLTFSPSELRLEVPSPVTVPARPIDAFSLVKGEHLFAGLGKTDEGVTPLAVRSGFIEVVSAGSGRVMIHQPIVDEKPAVEPGWQPLEFLIAVDAAGVVGPPALTESSLVPSVNAFFQEYLVKRLHIGERLPPGFYRVSIGP